MLPSWRSYGFANSIPRCKPKRKADERRHFLFCRRAWRKMHSRCRKSQIWDFIGRGFCDKIGKISCILRKTVSTAFTIKRWTRKVHHNANTSSNREVRWATVLSWCRPRARHSQHLAQSRRKPFLRQLYEPNAGILGNLTCIYDSENCRHGVQPGRRSAVFNDLRHSAAE